MSTFAAAVAAVQRLHDQRVFNGDGYGWTICAECRQAWPCATIDAVNAALAEQPEPGGA